MSMEVPEYLKQGNLGEAAAKALADTASMASASMSIPRISLRGREFRFIDGGEEIARYRDSMDIIIFGVEPDAGRMVKTWYKDGYKPGAKEPPTCASDDGISPSQWVSNKQSQTCASCKLNAFGSAVSPTGKPTKACRDSKRIWISRIDDPKPISERTLFGLNVTVASLKSFAEHGRVLQGLGQPAAVAVTRVTMMDTEFPQLEFKLVGWLPAAEATLSLELSVRRPWAVMSGAGMALAFSGGDEGGGKTIGLPGGTVAPPEGRVAMPTEQRQVTDINKDINTWN